MLCFEPLPSAITRFRDQYHQEMYNGNVRLCGFALGDKNGTEKLHITSGDGQGSSLLLPTEAYQKEHPEYDYAADETVEILIRRFEDLVKNEDIEFDPDLYDCLTIDTQGNEMDVLKGIGDYLKGFKYLNIELSEPIVYEGGVSGTKVAEYLKERGFVQDSPMEAHNDVFFVREDVWHA